MKVLLLLSGGIDSPVAGKLLKDAGYDIVPLHFSYEPFVNNAPEMKCRAAIKKLGFAELTVVKLGKALEAIVSSCNNSLYFVLSKRMMYRIAERVAKENDCEFIATGESLAQVSSQTLQNLVAIDSATSMQVLRPLIGLDKLEIIDIANEIDTFELSKGPEVCDVLGPKHPNTSARISEVEKEEAKIDIEGLVNALLAI